MRLALFVVVLFLFQFSLAGRTNGYVPISSCARHMQKALRGNYVDEHLKPLEWANASSETIIVDTNYIVSLSRVAGGGADAHEIRYVAEIESLKRRMKASGLNPQISVSSETAYESSSIPGVKIPQGTTLVNSSISRKPGGSYDALLNELEMANVGGSKANSASDRQIVADAFFSKRTGTNDIPKFATGDMGIIVPLCRKNPACSKVMDGPLYNSSTLRRTYPTGFPVSISDKSKIVRTITVVPL